MITELRTEITGKKMKFDFWRFCIVVQWARKELWYVDWSDGSKHWILFDVSACDRVTDNESYKGWQIIFLNLAISISNRKSLVKNETQPN